MEVHGYKLLNSAREVRHKGNDNCVIYTCNAYKSVLNLRFSTKCDVINFRATQVLRDGRNVALNWLKVLGAIWITENEHYDNLVYTDRDLILTTEPLDLAGLDELVFPDLGGGEPDSAMFIGNAHENATSSSFFNIWLDQETGETNRRDGGEEQEALLNMFKTMELKIVPDLYSFQCGRNSMNRAQCLLRGQFISWNKPLLFTKVTVELSRIFLYTYFRSRVWMPTLFLSHQGTFSIPNTLACLVSITEVVLYNQVFSARPLRETKCSAAGVKAISHGSFDNPFQATLTGVYTDGIAKRGPFGWNCYEMYTHDERWYTHHFGELQTFTVAQATVALFSAMFKMRHLLNPLHNMQMSTQKRDWNALKREK